MLKKAVNCLQSDERCGCKRVTRKDERNGENVTEEKRVEAGRDEFEEGALPRLLARQQWSSTFHYSRQVP